jgi:hypothetical protein
VIRPDGKPHHPEDGWEDEGKPLAFAVAPKVETTSYSKALTLPWERLIRLHTETPNKASAPLWSPVFLSDMARKSSSVTHITALVYDFDHGETWDDVVSMPKCYGMRFWAYSTFSHTEEAHRFRLVLAVDEAIPVALYPQVWRGFARMVGWKVDESCKDLARLYYVPSCPPGGLAWQDWGDGPGLDWRGWLKTWEAQAGAEKRKARPEVAAPRPRREAIQSPQFRSVTLRNVAQTLFDSMDPDSPHDEWRNACFAVVQSLGEEGMQMVEAWSRKGAKFDPDQMRSIRRRFNLG